MTPLPEPEPWLQYGAFGLHALTLCMIIGFITVVVLKAGGYFTGITEALNRLANALTELKVFTETKLDSLEQRDGEFRAKLDSLQRRTTPPKGLPRTDPHITRHPTTRMTPAHVKAVWDAQEQRERPGKGFYRGKVKEE